MANIRSLRIIKRDSIASVAKPLTKNMMIPSTPFIRSLLFLAALRGMKRLWRRQRKATDGSDVSWERRTKIPSMLYAISGQSTHGLEMTMKLLLSIKSVIA